MRGDDEYSEFDLGKGTDPVTGREVFVLARPEAGREVVHTDMSRVDHGRITWGRGADPWQLHTKVTLSREELRAWAARVHGSYLQ